MIRESFSLRRAAIAVLFPGQPELRREDMFDFYKKVTAEGIDVPQFNQSDTAVQLLRRASGDRPNQFQIEVGRHQGNFRFLTFEEWPTNRTLKMIGMDADAAWECFQQVWSPSRLRQKPVLVEVNLRTTAAAKGGNATEFLANECFRLSPSGLQELGRDLRGIGCKLMFPVEVSTGESEQIPLNEAGGNIRVETLIDDPSRLYFEAQFQWPSVAVPSEVKEQTGAPEKINPEIRKLSEYLSESDSFIKSELTRFLVRSSRE